MIVLLLLYTVITVILLYYYLTVVSDFWNNFEFTIFHDFFLFSLTWDPMEVKTSIRYSSLISLLNFSLTSPEFSSPWPSQKYCFGFLEVLSWRFFTILFTFINMGPYGSKNFKTLLLPQINFSWIFISVVLTNLFLYFFFIFLIFDFFRLYNFSQIFVGEISLSPWCHIRKQNTAIISKGSYHRMKRSEIWSSGAIILCKEGTFDS